MLSHSQEIILVGWNNKPTAAALDLVAALDPKSPEAEALVIQRNRQATNLLSLAEFWAECNDQLQLRKAAEHNEA